MAVASCCNNRMHLSSRGEAQDAIVEGNPHHFGEKERELEVCEID